MRIKAVAAALSACICATCLPAQAHEATKEEPAGKAIVQVFANLHAGLNRGRNDRGFGLDRCYLGYEHKPAKGLTIKGVIDMGASVEMSDHQLFLYIKNAMISWQKGGLTLNGGLIPTTQFNFQEKFWSYRYVMKSFQDQYKFGSSADVGVSAAYRFTKHVCADAIVVNGEGYKKIRRKEGFNYGLGVTVTPAEGFYMRLYGGLNRGAGNEGEDIVNMAAFAGYKCDIFTTGAEYNHMLSGSFGQTDRYGYSVFASLRLTKNTDLYARFDHLRSKKEADEKAAIIGAQFKPCKYIKISPNLRINMPGNNYSAYLNCSFGF